MRHAHRNSGFTLLELLLCLAAVVLLLAVALPPMARVDAMSRTAVSLDNLRALGAAHAMYAFDWNGRQFTNVVDDLPLYGDNEFWAYQNYEDQHGEDHPPVLLGWGCCEDGSCGCGLWGYWMSNPGNWGLCQPMVWPGGPGPLYAFGVFRIPNVRPFHDYVNGRFYGPRFYPPNDTVPYALAEPLFDSPYEFVPDAGTGNTPWWSSYCFSPAAMFNPLVMAHPGPGEMDGWHNPWNFLAGFESPSLSQALYPDLKTQIIEHHWNQNAPEDPCNPNFSDGTYEGCEPYYFNHSIDSEPATLFYDMSTRLLPNREVLAADEWMIEQVGYGLWSRDTPFGDDGYFIQYGFDGTPLSHHVLTTDGIRGRDTLPPGCFASRGEK
jgi:prepilin-type N-terminal cleavage/methylation domain-containing protein